MSITHVTLKTGIEELHRDIMASEKAIDTIPQETERPQWYVLRDLKRANAKFPAYRQLRSENFEVFTPMKWRIVTLGGRRHKQEIPYIPDLLFVHARPSELDPVIARTPTLQYRFVKGRPYREAMTVGETEMDDFIKAVCSTGTPRYYSPEELTPSMYGKRVRVIGGKLDNYEGYLLNARGAKKKRIIVELPTLLIAAVEVSLDYIEFI